MPLIYPPIPTQELLFIGLNPSFNSKGIKSILKDTSLYAINPEEFYHWRNKNKYDIETAIFIEKISRDKYPFYAKFREMARYCKVSWGHIDLFFYRETRQNNFKTRIFQKDELNQFGRDQMNLAKRLIESVSPKVIVVANAFASELFRREYDTHFNESAGCDLTQIGGNVVQVFLASMLTGQRAKDKYSYERLLWQVNKTLNI